MIDHLKKLLSIKSITERGNSQFPYGKGPAEAMDCALALCSQFGFSVKNADYRYGFAEIGTQGPIIGILAHLDVVPAGSDWSFPPFSGTEKDGRIYGRGAQDDKGPAIACIYAMKEILDSRKVLNKRIRLIFGQTEETGDWDDIKAYTACEEPIAFGFTPDSCFPAISAEKGIMILKVTAPLSGSGFVSVCGGSAPNMVPDLCSAQVLNEKGDLQTFSAQGISAHGSTPDQGENAITSLMQQLQMQSPYAAAYMKTIGKGLHGEGLGRRFSDKESGSLTMNAGVIESDDKEISLYLDIRYPVTFTKEQIMEQIAAALENTAFPMSASCFYHAAPSYTDSNRPGLQAILRAYGQITGDHSEPLVIGGGTYAKSMENIVAFGPALPGHAVTEHEKDEYILIEDMFLIKKIYRNALENLLDLDVL